MATKPLSGFIDLTDQTLQGDAVGIKEFLQNNTLPCFARMVKEFRNRRGLEKGPDAEVNVYVPSALKVNYVVADEMSVVHRKHIQPTSQRFYVSTDCKGWFEVLSQDGISARPFGSIMELSKMPTSSRCLVRQSIGGYVRKAEGYDSQIVRKGDVLTLSETMWVSMRSGGNSFNKQLLRCVDQRGQEVFLDLNQRGVFSPIAGTTNVTGAHTIQSLLTKFRLPVMVRLLYGNIHQAVGSTYSTGVFKLITVFSDEILFAIPLKSRSDDRILPIPTRARSLKFKPYQKIRNDMEHNLKRQCKHLISRHLDTIVSVPALYESIWLADIELEPLITEEKKDRIVAVAGGSRTKSSHGSPEEEELFREIEDIYNAIGCTPAPRPIVFNTDPVARNKGVKRNTTGVSKVRTVHQRLSPPTHKATHVIDDNWQMLPRQVTTTASALYLHNASDLNAVTTDVQVQSSPKHERSRRRPTPKTAVMISSTPKTSSKPQGDHLYEEIPYFSQTNVDATGMDIQKTMYISDIDNSFPDVSHEISETDSALPNTAKPKEVPSIDLTLPRAMSPDIRKSPKTPTIDSSPNRKRLSRPKSFAGIFFPNDVKDISTDLEDQQHPPLPPPPLPPKRGESMCNLIDEFQTAEALATINDELCETPSSLPDTTTSSDPQDAEDPTQASALPKSSSAVERRPSSKVVSSAVKTLGNVSRSVINTFKRFGGRSSATLVINSPDDPKQMTGGTANFSCAESVAKSSSGSSPEPQSLSEKPAAGELSVSVKADNDLLSC